MADMQQQQWGPWIRHRGGGMPVPAGTLVDVYTLAPLRSSRDGPRRKVGIAGVDLVKSWNWTPENRATFRSLPIDFYRIGRPKGLAFLEGLLEQEKVLEDA
ncbi:hypothetical protein HKCCSP123_14075 [Rhodobacterales bacterium HKCCSP123]|nr:hypothetical protein [Rhodobacterales bacterium HKCCSP123]